MHLECQECHKVLNLPDSKLPVGKPFSFTCPYCKRKNTARLPASGEAVEQFQAPPPPAPDPPRDEWAPPAPQPSAGDDWSQPQPEAPAGDEWAAPLPQPQADWPPQPDITSFPVEAPAPPPPADPDAPAMQRPPQAYEDRVEEDAIQSLLAAGLDERPKALIVYDDDEVADLLATKLEALGHRPTVALNMRDAAKQLKFADFGLLIIQEDYFGTSLGGNQLLRSVQHMDNQYRRGMLVVLISPTMTTLDDLQAFALSLDAIINQSDIPSIDRLLLSIVARARKFYASYREILGELGMD